MKTINIEPTNQASLSQNSNSIWDLINIILEEVSHIKNWLLKKQKQRMIATIIYKLGNESLRSERFLIELTTDELKYLLRLTE